MLEIREGSCLPRVLVGVNVGLVCVDSIIAILAFTQLIRIHLRNSQLGWTRQKVFHLLIGSSNVGFFLYFALTLVAACYKWPCWSYCCGFIAMAIPRILLFAAFLLLLSFWIDLCHQADEEEEEDDDEYGFLEALLKRSLHKPGSSSADSHRICFPFQSIHVGSRQKIVILVTVLVFLIMITFAVVIWIGMGDNPINSSVVAQVYVALFTIAMLLLGGALACYGLLLCLKMRTVRSERASSEMWKIAGLAVVSVLCFTPSAIIALSTGIPVLYHWQELQINGVYTISLLILYYFVGSSVPSIFVLWVMRELPPVVVTNRRDESRMIAFIHDSSAAAIHQPERWTTAASTQSQISSVSPI
ncbi:tobamovirus multiplication protein 1-like [Pistacia vera]|uniref:tobamovirus multiplication protein 1-like n=1 Tax=Pistacia vera TaxID=55513 RepID=UPI001263A112|nr:tobamovirus multiplication protein 1-like [Pistacia vera]